MQCRHYNTSWLAQALPGPVCCANIHRMSQPTSLYLAPEDPWSAPEIQTVKQVLDALDVTGEQLGPDSFAAGEGFSRHVVYAGCSPFLIMKPPEDGSLRFCHVVLHGPFARPRLVTGPNTVKPRCPACRARFPDWRERLAGWGDASEEARCASCGAACSAHELDWRGHAVSGRILVELRNVFPGEASPSDPLMQRLHEQTGETWRHAWAAYLCD
jgi:hypothetical protein